MLKYKYYAEFLIRYSPLPLNNVSVSSRTSGDFFVRDFPENINIYMYEYFDITIIIAKNTPVIKLKIYLKG